MNAVKRVAALYDIHGNLPALEATLDDVRKEDVDLVIVGGDVVPGPMPRETLDCLLALDLPTQFIHGNGDREVLNCRHGHEMTTVPEQFREPVRWTAQQLDSNHERAIASWPSTLRIKADGIGEVLFCHATPRNDIDVFTKLTPAESLMSIFDEANADVVICGHTHMQFDRTIGRTRVLNAGSVGMPFGEPGAYWLMLGSNIELRRTSYNLAGAAERIRRTDYPPAENFAAHHVLQPPSEKELLERFSAAQLK